MGVGQHSLKSEGSSEGTSPSTDWAGTTSVLFASSCAAQHPSSGCAHMVWLIGFERESQTETSHSASVMRWTMHALYQGTMDISAFQRCREKCLVVKSGLWVGRSNSRCISSFHLWCNSGQMTSSGTPLFAGGHFRKCWLATGGAIEQVSHSFCLSLSINCRSDSVPSTKTRRPLKRITCQPQCEGHLSQIIHTVVCHEQRQKLFDILTYPPIRVARKSIHIFNHSLSGTILTHVPVRSVTRAAIWG